MHLFLIWPHLRSPPLHIPSLALYSSFEITKISPTRPGWSLYDSLTLPNPTILLFICCKCQGPHSTPKHNVKFQFLIHNPYSW